MSIPILATKLYTPPLRSKVVLRSRLIERLNEGLLQNGRFARKLTFISAPAGFGKTTLAAEWLASGKAPACWLSLDKEDREPLRFLAYLISALHTIAPHFDRVLALLQSPQPPPAEFLWTTLLNEIAALRENIILVLDDYHTLENRTVDEAVNYLLEHLPPQLHLVITTREDPELPLARMRARGELIELRAADLRFTPKEAVQFFNWGMGLKLSAQDIAALDTRTEGWIAGLQLAALALQGQRSMPGEQEVTNFIASFTGSHHFVLDYLVEEVLQQQSGGVQAFLLSTSILERMCGSLCDAVLLDSATSAQRILEALERANLFIIPLDNERQWYRYHRLFAELLRQRLHASAASSNGDKANSVAKLHARASSWFEKHDLPDEAFRHAIAAGDCERAARVAERAWPSTFSTSFQNTLFIEWMKELPDELVQSRPVLSVGYGWALLDIGELEQAEARLRDAERGLDAMAAADGGGAPSGGALWMDEEVLDSLPAHIAVGRAYIAIALGDVVGCVTHAQLALALLPEANHQLHGGAAALLGLAYLRSGDLDAAYVSIAKGTEEMVLTGIDAFAISGTGGLADIRMTQGRLHEAIRLYEQSLRLATEHGGPALQGTADLHLGLSGLCLELGDIQTARQHLHRSDELGAPAGLPDWEYRSRVARFRLKTVEGDLAGALQLLGEAEQVYYRTPLLEAQPVAALKAHVYLKQGRVADALGWAREKEVSVADELSYPREFEHITLARVLIARYKQNPSVSSLDEVVGFLERLRQAAEQGGRTGSLIEILIVQALAHEAQGDIPSALASLRRALTLAEPEGYVRVFIAEGPPMQALLSQAAERGFMPRYAQRLMTAFGETTLAIVNEPRQTTQRSPADRFEPLTPRELEILQLIAQGLTNQEIGARLFLALSTVKGHNRVLFDKLRVSSRTEAVARGRALGLL